MNFYVLLIAFSLSLLPTLLGPIFFPLIKLTYFAPFLIILMYKKKNAGLFAFTLVAGFIIDLLSAHTPFGFWIINYGMTLWVLLFFKPFFFEDKLLTLPLLTIFFSQISTFLYVVAMNFFFLKVQISFGWILTDLIVYPMLDGIFALLAFHIPLLYLNRLLPAKRRSTKSFRLAKD